MEIFPDERAFGARHAEGKAQLVWTTLVADLETPVSAYLKLARNRANSFLFESVEGGAVRGRYSIIGFDPDVIFRVHGASAEINRNARNKGSAFEAVAKPPLEAIRALIEESKLEVPDGLPPMAAGVFGNLGYDMVRLMEKLPAQKPDPLGIADATLIRPTIVVVFDAVKDTMTVITPVRPASGTSAKSEYAQAVERLTAVVDALDLPLNKEDIAHADETIGANAVSNTTAAEYEAMVAQAKEYIFAGDIFQVVLSQRFESEFRLPPFALYRALRRVNPAPFLYFLDFGDFSVAGSSPEILVRARDNKVTIRPIAGTRPRGATPHDDKALEDELLADPKERAEHLMLLDLGRNDVGRVSKIGTVKVTDQFFIERYSHVMHIVSNVEGEMHPSHDALSALVAGFPAGTVSGAPKVRAMQIIDELEKEKRGVYAGCVGYFAADGSMDTCIVLRTAIVKDGKMYVQAGAGIVADSNPASEQLECENKAKALFRAAEEARRFASAAKRGQ
ncbi:MAG: anthranilate synthase component I [Xanthobacteraceae bacterium]|nr:anthranilate synthase component I [Xanthobacteraceae bacterium]QYK46440.1 MAG: anthranilate synthase component I [Xanthobacteraceae bacterium]